MTTICRLSLFLAAALSLGGCAIPEPRVDAWQQLVDEFVEADFAARPSFAVYQGRHEFDGKLADVSPAGLQRQVAMLHGFRDRAARFDAQSLDAGRRFEREYLVSVIDGQLFWLETMRQPFVNPAYYARVMSPDVYLEREYAPLEQRLRAFVAYERGIPAVAKQMRANLETPMPRTYVQLGHIIMGGMASHFEKEVPRIFAPVADAALQAELRESNGAAIAALKELDAWIQAQMPAATDRFAIGPQRFAQMLHDTERVDIPLAELKAMGERDLERNLAALAEACGRFAPGAPVKACVDRAQGKKPADGPVKEASRQLADLRRFILDHHVVTIPSPELAQVREAPAYERWNTAYMSAPGPYEKNLPSFYFIAPPDPAWTPAEQLAYIPDVDDLLFISVHEIWPGHFLQHLHAKRLGSKVARLYWTYAFGEGWAHYTEQMMCEEGLCDGDPARRIAQATNALLRDVRYLSAIGLHTGGMTVAESEAMFREKAFQDPGNARQQAARGTFDPGYGNYTLGKLMILGMRDAWMKKHPGATLQAFHDQLLSYGSPPLPLVRKAMMQ